MATKYDSRLGKLEGQGAELVKVHACPSKHGKAPELGEPDCYADICVCAAAEAEHMRVTRGRGKFIRLSHSEAQF